MKLSLIIPVYNVEDYIQECLSSVLSQSLSKKDYEIILINDGSTDGSLDVIRSFMEYHDSENIQLISQKNKGLSASRNIGISNAKGDYIWFIDSDDWIEPNCLENIVQYIDKSGIDILALTTYLHQDKNLTVIHRNCQPQSIMPGSEIFHKTWIYPYSGAQFYIFKSSFLKKNCLTFFEGIYFEDMLFTPKALNLSSMSMIYEVPVYNYRIRSNSITTTSVSIKKAKDYLFIINELEKNYFSCAKEDKSIYAKVILSIMTILTRRYLGHLEESDSEDIRRNLKNDILLKRIISENKSLKYRIIYIILYYFPFACGR